MNKRKLILAGTLGVAIIILAAFYFFLQKNDFGSNNKAFDVEQTDLALQELPSGFPKDLPVESGSKTLKNFQTKATDGRAQSTRIMTTSKSLAEIVAVYEDFFKSKDWVQTPTTSQAEGTLTALFRKQNDLVSIVARTDSKTDQNTVEINLVLAPSNPQ